MPESAAVSPASSNLKGEVTVVEPDRFERAIARRGAEVRATIPSVDHQAVVDIDTTLARAAELDCSLAALVVHATATALRAVPRANAAYRDGQYEEFSKVNIGVTLIADGLYVTPTVFDADQKSPAEISTELTGYQQRALTLELHPSELSGATFTVLDATGSRLTAVAPLITAPQAGALAIGAVQPAAVVRDGAVVAGHTLTLTLSADHRILFGTTPMTFLAEIKSQLEQPQR